MNIIGKANAVSTGKFFAAAGLSAEDRLRTRQQAAEDLHAVIERFAEHAGLKDRPGSNRRTVV